MMEQLKALNVAIVGGGPGCKAIMDMIFAERLSQLRMKLIGVACTNPKAVGYRYAQEKGVYTTQDYRNLYQLNDLNMIIELTGRDEVVNEIFRTKPDHIRLMGHVSARLFWDVFRIEEKRIVERKRAEEALRKSEQEKRAILNSMSEYVVYHDAEHRMVWANGVARQVRGLAPEELVGRRCYEVWHDLSKPCPGCPVVKTYETLQPQKAEMTSPDGRVWFVRGYPLWDENDDIAGVVEVTMEITERKRAEEALRESEERYHTVLEASPDPVVAYDMEGKSTYINPAFTRVFGWTSEELLGKELDYVPDENWPERQMIIDKVLAGESFTGVESRRYAKDGSILDVSISAAIHLDRDGIPVGSVHILRDITDHKRLEAQFQQAQKMEAIGTLAGGIAHDFNNLLMGIQGNVSLMLMHIDSTHPHYERLNKIEKQVQSCARLTSQLLGYARKGKYEIKSINLNQLVQETCETFGRTKKEITIHRELEEHLFSIEADQGQIQQVLLNLFINAADAMPGSGDLILKTTNTTHNDMKGKLYEPKPGNYVLLTVTDTGIGMDKETVERIFDPFFTTKEMGRGTGLGLASTYGIVKSHGGYIDVESKKGHGTTFSIYLPASEKDVKKVVKTSEGIIKGTGTVLLVDDEEVILEVGKDLLEAMGYRVLVARDGEEAIEVYRKNQGEIDFVVLDMVMPNMGGGEAYDRIKEINPDIKVLLSSGYSIDSQAKEILARGCDAFIQKPFGIQELSQGIRQIQTSTYDLFRFQ